MKYRRLSDLYVRDAVFFCKGFSYAGESLDRMCNRAHRVEADQWR